MNIHKSSSIAYMARGIYILIAILFVGVANAASVRGVATASRSGVANVRNQTDNPGASYTYNYMYPYMNNDMRTTLNPGVTTSQSTSPINAVVRTENLSAPRRVVARPTPNANAARVATATASMASTPRRVVSRPTPNTNSARVAMNTPTNNNPRRVVARPNSSANVARNTNSRVQDMFYPVDNPISKTSTSARCLADYAECMNMYCERADTAYNRCYCSAKLAQIDAEYQPQIESLIQQIILLKSGGDAVDTGELNEYWGETISKYTGDNSWDNLDAALDIDWSTMESRVRGQNAFITGHQYCAQHISGCFYMADNLRDAYRSTISKDCTAYESSLQRLKAAAESVIEAYHE